MPDNLHRLKITSNGSPGGTSVVDSETGAVLPVVSVDWHIDMKGVATATVKTYAQIEVEGKGRVFVLCPGCGKGIEDRRTLNMYDPVRVRLQERGRAIYRDYYRRTAEILRRPASDPPVDADGWTTLQLRDLMMIFGPHIVMGFETPFETTIDIAPTH